MIGSLINIQGASSLTQTRVLFIDPTWKQIRYAALKGPPRCMTLLPPDEGNLDHAKACAEKIEEQDHQGLFSMVAKVKMEENCHSDVLQAIGCNVAQLISHRQAALQNAREI